MIIFRIEEINKCNTYLSSYKSVGYLGCRLTYTSSYKSKSRHKKHYASAPALKVHTFRDLKGCFMCTASGILRHE